MKRLLIFVFLLIPLIGFAQSKRVVQVNIAGGIGPATADFIERAVTAGQDAELVLIVMDTPGGLDSSTRIIVQSLLASKVPVVTYVAPSGARAASAGTFILYASTIAAMAPSTHLGAATPVQIGGGAPGGVPETKPQDKSKEKEEKKAETDASPMKQKVMQDAVAYIRGLAEHRGRNAEFAEKAVMEAATMTASEALKNNVINLVAADVSDLLKQLDGTSVDQMGQTIKLNTSDVQIEHFHPDWRTRFLFVITDPTVAYLLLILGIYGIFFELFNPGFLVPGIVGGIAILIAMYALQMLPINYAGLALILLGIAFIIAEIYSLSFGALGIGGTVAFVVGSILLMDTEVEGFQIAWSAILGMAAANIVLFGTFLAMVLRSRKVPFLNATEHLVGECGRVINPLSPHGQIMINGEIWEAKSERPVATGEEVKVIAVSNLELEVEPLNDSEKTEE